MECGWYFIISKVDPQATFAYSNNISFSHRVIKDSEGLQEKQVPRETEWVQISVHHCGCQAFQCHPLITPLWHVLSIMLIEHVLSVALLLPHRGLKVPEEFRASLGPKETRYVLSCSHQAHFSKWLLTHNKTLENDEGKKTVTVSKRQRVSLCVFRACQVSMAVQGYLECLEQR